MPPISKDSFLNEVEDSFAIFSPVLVPPVKDIALIFGCLTISEPTLFPSPWTILITPLGKFIFIRIFASLYAVKGDISDGLAITVLPVTRAGAIFHVNKYKGKFQGDMHPTTPNGWREIKFEPSSPFMLDLNWNDLAWSAKNLKLDIARGISIFFDRLIGLPVSRDSSWANSSKFISICVAISIKYCALTSIFRDDQFGKDFKLASTALSMSERSELATLVYFLPIAGSITSIYSLDSGSTNSPFI